MNSFDDLLQQIEKEVKKLRFDDPPRSLYDPIVYILSLGGKRLRPALTLMACNLYTDDIDIAMAPALGLEVFHNFTLLHDDLMDHAPVRRKKPTVHNVWNENAAILSGDAMLIAAYQLIGRTDPTYLKQILDLFTQTALEICGGQQYDMEFENRNDVTEEEYIEMIRLKTAVLLACCLKTGALLGGASARDADNLYQFGICIGLAFQLQDDLLDVYGDPETFGKNIGGDILCNKKTFLLINALRLSSSAQQKELKAWITKTSFDPHEKIAAVTSIYNVSGVKDLAVSRMNDYYTRAMAYIAQLKVEPTRLDILTGVVKRLMSRQF